MSDSDEKLDLSTVDYRNRKIIFGTKPFGPDWFKVLGVEFERKSYLSADGSKWNFRLPSTSESIAIASYEILNKGRDFLEYPGLNLGLVYISSRGVYVNSPFSNEKIDEADLKPLLKGCKAKRFENGTVYLSGDGSFGYAPLDSFPNGPQKRDDFIKGGLAAVLTNSFDQSIDLMRILDRSVYEYVNVTGFLHDESTPLFGRFKRKKASANLRVIRLVQDNYEGKNILEIQSDFINQAGFSFGVVIEE